MGAVRVAQAGPNVWKPVWAMRVITDKYGAWIYSLIVDTFII